MKRFLLLPIILATLVLSATVINVSAEQGTENATFVVQ